MSTNPMEQFLNLLSNAERQQFSALKSPIEIQEYLDSIPYSPEDRNRCPLNVLRDRQAHCLDGALLAAAALRHLGHPPMVIDVLPEPKRDDDHVLAIFRSHGCFGALAKSNYVGLRYREPVYRSLRELVMSYFDVFFNTEREKTMRAYTVPLYLERMDAFNWLSSDQGADEVEKQLKTLRQYSILTPTMINNLTLVDTRSHQAGLYGSNPDGLYKPH